MILSRCSQISETFSLFPDRDWLILTPLHTNRERQSERDVDTGNHIQNEVYTSTQLVDGESHETYLQTVTHKLKIQRALFFCFLFTMAQCTRGTRQLPTEHIQLVMVIKKRGTKTSYTKTELLEGGDGGGATG